MTEYPNINIAKSEGLNWVVIIPCVINIDTHNIIIPKGFITDLISVPRIFWSIIPPHGIASNASIVHDFCWRNSIFDRKTCDKIFLSLLKQSKVPKWQYYIMYSFVRAFGWMKNNKIK